MKRPVLLWGAIAGALAIATTLATLPFLRTHQFRGMDLVGYTAMVLSALVVFFGVRDYREREGGGRLSFGRGLAVGLLITVVASLVHATAFQAISFGLVPDYDDQMAACMVERAKAAGAQGEKLEAARRQAETIRKLMANPATNAALVFVEPVPVGLVAAAIAAAILRRR